MKAIRSEDRRVAPLGLELRHVLEVHAVDRRRSPSAPRRSPPRPRSCGRPRSGAPDLGEVGLEHAGEQVAEGLDVRVHAQHVVVARRGSTRGAPRDLHDRAAREPVERLAQRRRRRGGTRAPRASGGRCARRGSMRSSEKTSVSTCSMSLSTPCDHRLVRRRPRGRRSRRRRRPARPASAPAWPRAARGRRGRFEPSPWRTEIRNPLPTNSMISPNSITSSGSM